MMTVMLLTRRRDLRSHCRLSLADINRWHLVMDAIREGIIPAVMVDLPAPLRFLVLDFRSISRRFLHFLTTGDLLWPRRHR